MHLAAEKPVELPQLPDKDTRPQRVLEVEEGRAGTSAWPGALDVWAQPQLQLPLGGQHGPGLWLRG